MKPRLRLLSYVMIMVFLTSACQLTSSVGKQGDSGGGNGSASPKAQERFKAPANPLNLTLQLDEQKAASAIIPAKGGDLSATGSDGTTFTLSIPEGALLVDTEIRMIPVSAIADLPLSGGLGGAVKFEPDGLFFYQDVFLTIKPAHEIPIENQIMFGFDGDGKNMSLAMPVVDSKEIRIRLQHFSGVGVGNGLSPEKAAIYNRIADRVEARITNELSQKLGRERQLQLQLLGKEDAGGLEDLAAYFDEYENQVVKSRIKAAMAESASCADGLRAIQTYLGFERQRQLLGMGKAGGLADIQDLLTFSGKKCVDEEYKLCAEKHVLNRMIPQWLGIKRQYALIGYDETASGENELIKYARERTEACLHFEVQFNSQAQLNDDQGKKIYSSNVESRLKLKMDGSDISHLFRNQAPLVNTEFTFVVDNSECKTTSMRGGGNFDVSGLSWNYEQKDGQEILKDITLSYFPGSTSESYTVTCPDSTYTSPPGGYWTGIYMVLHFEKEFGQAPQDSPGSAPAAPPAPQIPQVPDINDLLKSMSEGSGTFVPVMPLSMPVGSGGPGGFVAKDWKIAAGDIIATKEWEMKDPTLGLVETGLFTLFHTPAK